MHKELLGSRIARSAYIESKAKQAKIGLLPKGYIFKVLNFPDYKPLIEDASLKLLEYLDFNMIEKPVILIEPPVNRLNLGSSIEAAKWVVKGVRHFEEELCWEDPLVACIGISKSRFPFEGALLQAYNILKPLFSTDLQRVKSWVIIECSSSLYSKGYLNWTIYEIRALLNKPDIKVIHPDADSKRVILGVYLNTSDPNKFLSSLVEEGDPLYDLELHELDEKPLRIELPIPLLEEG